MRGQCKKRGMQAVHSVQTMFFHGSARREPAEDGLQDMGEACAGHCVGVQKGHKEGGESGDGEMRGSF